MNVPINVVYHYVYIMFVASCVVHLQDAAIFHKHKHNDVPTVVNVSCQRV